ncbi:MAG: hemerythrin domain-containing protein [Mizugakiibacter sp.]|uniref:hemerythrin domain-containing protein n=1 Tax=Mizugakiibacter sp. TaxID=1972610 RepID=UPI0031CC2147|nr:hypothetical protein [Xanthomonadaceae bacterium]
MLKLDVMHRQHRAIRALLQALGATAIDTPDGQTLLRLARTTILNHVHEEDLEFYSALAREAEVGALADAYYGEIRETSRQATAFFDACAEGGDLQAYADGFDTICRLIVQRMDREEMRLFAAYSATVDGDDAPPDMPIGLPA